MEKLKVEEFRTIRKNIDEIFEEFKPYIENEELAESLSEEEKERIGERLDAAGEQINELFASLKTYDLSEISFEEWNGFRWLTNEYNLEGTGANLDFSLIKVYDSNGICRFKGCDIQNFDFENIRFDDDSFDESFKQAHEEHFLSKTVTDPEVRKRYYTHTLTIADAITWNLTNVPIKNFYYNHRSLVEKIGLERAKTIDLELLSKLEYQVYDYLEDESFTEEVDINDFIIDQIEKEIQKGSWKMDTFESIPLVKERLSEYFIDFGDSEQLKLNFHSNYLSVGRVIENYEIFKGKKYARSLYANNHGQNITEEQIENFYKEVEELVPTLLRIGIDWESEIETFPFSEDEEGKKAYLKEMLKSKVTNSDTKERLTLKDIYELSKYVEIGELEVPHKDTLNSIVEAKGTEALNELGHLSLENLNPKDLEGAKVIGDMIGTYEFLHYSVGSFVRKYGMDNLLRLNRESEGMLDAFIMGNMGNKENKLYDKIHYDHSGKYAFPENGTYEDFENIFVQMLTEVYDRTNLNYGRFRGKFSERHPEIYLPEDAPQELSDKYYTRKLSLGDFTENPEWKPYFENARVGIGLSNKEVKIKDSLNYINIYDYLELNDHHKKDDVFNLLLAYGSFFDHSDFTFFEDIELEQPFEKVKEFVEEQVYLNIKSGFTYSENLPEEFKTKYADIFISDRVPEEIKEKIYLRNIVLKDFRKIDILEEELKDKDLTVILSKILNSDSNIKRMYQKIGNEKFLEYAHKYGEYMSNLTISEHTPVEEIEDLIKANITENVLNGFFSYGPDAPAFLKETHPEWFLSEDAPEFLKLSFYSIYTSSDPEYLNHSGTIYRIRPRNLLEHPEWIEFLEGKNLVPGTSREYKELFSRFTPAQVLEFAKTDVNAIEAIAQNDAFELFEKFLNEESKNFAYRELLENEEYDEGQIKAALESEELSNEEYAKIRSLYDKKVEKFKGEIIRNPGVFMDYPYEKIEEFNFGEYRELKALSNFSESRDCKRYMEENLISHIYAFLGYAEAKKLLQLPEMSKEEIDRLITEQQESFDAVYEKKFKLKGKIKVLNTFFEKLDPILPAGKVKFQIYKSINQRLEEGFEGDISELLGEALNENNVKFSKEKLDLCVSNAQGIQVAEKMSFIKDEMIQKINDTIPENAADKKIIYDNLFYALKDSLNVHKRIDKEYIETLLKKEFSRLKEDGTTFYSPHVTEHISEMMTIIDGFNSNPYISKVLNLDLKGLLAEEKEKIGNGWIRKALTISDNLTKEQLDELQTKLYGESGYSIDVTKEIELRDKTEEGRRKAFLLLQENDNPNLITYAKAEKMFNSFTGPYSERFAEFFVKHKEEILANPKYYTILQKMNDKFDKFVDNNENRYKAGKISLEELERYVNNNRYDGVKEGEYELEYVAKLAGLNEKYFPVAQKLFEEMKNRTHQTIPQVDITRGRFRGRILRLDDPLHLMVGDITTCCQAIGQHAGEGSMIHSATERNGSVFVVEEYDEYGNYVNTVSQSWTWRNGDRICFDNVEIPDTLEADLKSRGAHEDIFRVYQEAASLLLANDRKVMEKMLDSGKITREQYDSLVVKEVTMGTGCDDLIRNLSSETKNPLKKAKIVRPIEGSKGYDGVQKGKTPWIDSGGTQYIVAEMNPEERKELKPQGKARIDEIPLQYTRTREIISRKGYGIHEDICKALREMKTREEDESSVVARNNLSGVNQILDEENITDVEKVRLSMNTNEDWFILSVDTEEAIRIVDTSIVDGKYSAETQKEHDKKLAIEEFEKAMEQLILEATDSGKRFECEISESPKFDIFRKLSEEKIISIEEDGIITLEDRDKLKEKIDITRKNIEEGTIERNIADSIKSDDDGR